MSARYLVHLRNGTRVEAEDVEWAPSRVRVVQITHRIEHDDDANISRQVRDGVRVRQYPAAAVKFIEELDPPEAKR